MPVELKNLLESCKDNNLGHMMMESIWEEHQGLFKAVESDRVHQSINNAVNMICNHYSQYSVQPYQRFPSDWHLDRPLIFTLEGKCMISNKYESFFTIEDEQASLDTEVALSIEPMDID